MTSLRELNTNEDLEFCMQTQAHISSQLARASELADALDARLVNFETQRESVLASRHGSHIQFEPQSLHEK